MQVTFFKNLMKSQFASSVLPQIDKNNVLNRCTQDTDSENLLPASCCNCFLVTIMLKIQHARYDLTKYFETKISS